MDDTMIQTGANAVGIIGVSLIILAYWLVSAGKLGAADTRYHLLNFVGAILHIISLIIFWNLPSFIIECFWIAISLYGLWRVKALKS